LRQPFLDIDRYMIRFILILLIFIAGCKPRIQDLDICIREKEAHLTDFHLRTDSLGVVGAFSFTAFEKDQMEFLAAWNEGLNAIDIYNLDEGSIIDRIIIDEEGPKGIPNVDALFYQEDIIYLIDAASKRILKVGFDHRIELLNLRNIDFNDSGNPDMVFFSVSPEFGSVPLIHDHLVYFPVGTQTNFESVDYYKENVVGVYDLQESQGILSFGNWDKGYVQKNGYFGSLGEVSLSRFEDGIAISFPISPVVSLYDWHGEKVKDIWMASQTFPKQMEGLPRYNDDLQRERNFLITSPWFLKTFYHAKKKSLIRFEKKEQRLKKPDQTLNSTLFGEWYLHVSNDDSFFVCIDKYDISGNDHFLPISFPFKDGILIKKLNDENESILEFSYLEIQ
jgi:hypothetical protein